LKGRGLLAAPQRAQEKRAFNRPLKKSILQSILGGAALQRCDNRLFLNGGFSR
jgi:hypothetical protein